MTISANEALHQQGSEHLVTFTRDGKRYSLGHFPTRAQAEGALRRKLAALDAESADRASRRRLDRDEAELPAAPEGVVRARRVKSAMVAVEARVSPRLLAALVRYDPATGAMRPRPRAHGRGKLLCVEVAGVRLYAHRAAWCLAKGDWPRRRLRFVDERAANLAIDNLRETGDAEHAREMRLSDRLRSSLADQEGCTVQELDCRQERWLYAPEPSPSGARAVARASG